MDDSFDGAMRWGTAILFALALVLLLHVPVSTEDPQFDHYTMLIYTPVAVIISMGWLFGFVLWVLARNNIPFAPRTRCESNQNSNSNNTSNSNNENDDGESSSAPPAYLTHRGVFEVCVAYSMCLCAGVFGTNLYRGEGMYPGSLIPLLMYLPMFALLLLVFVPIVQHHLRGGFLKLLVLAWIPTADWWSRMFCEVLTSLSVALFRLEFTACIYASGTFLMHHVPARVRTLPECGPHSLNYTIAVPLVCSLPFVFRIGQCVTQLVKDRHNTGKHACALVTNLIGVAMVIVASLDGYFHLWRTDFSRWIVLDWVWLALLVLHVLTRWLQDVVYDWRLFSTHLPPSALFPSWAPPLLAFVNFLVILVYGLALSPRHLSEGWVVCAMLCEVCRRCWWMLLTVDAERAGDADGEDDPLLKDK